MPAHSLKHLLEQASLQDSKLVLAGEVNGHMLTRLLGHPVPVRGPLLVWLATEGGDVYSALGIYDYLSMLPCQVIIVASGYCMSAGTIILQAANQNCRLALPSTTIMLHDGDEALDGRPNDVEAWRTYHKKLSKQVYQIYDRCTGLEWKEKLSAGDYVITAKQALRDGLIDGIVGL